MTLEQASAFAVFALVAALTPGPSNVMLAATGSVAGLAGGLPCLAGVAAGMGVLMFSVAMGLGQLVNGIPAVLSLLNAVANAMLRLVKVNPQDQLAQVHGPEELRMLLEQSREHGLLGAEQHQMLTSMLELQGTKVADVMEPYGQIVTVRRDDPA